MIDHMQRDPEYFDHAHMFMPDRFLNSPNPYGVPGMLAFGAGRRACVGRTKSLQILCSVISAMIDIWDIQMEKPLCAGDVVPYFSKSVRARLSRKGGPERTFNNTSDV